MEAVILCGGLGTRLREETEFKPKPMVAIGDKPILWHIMRHYRRYGVRDFVLCLGYKGDVIREYFLNYKNWNRNVAVDLASGTIEGLSSGESSVDWRVSLVDTGQDTLTGTRIQYALPYIRGERFFATYGDGVANVDLDTLLTHHERSACLATVTAVHPSSRFGELDISGHLVTSFKEKPQVAGGWINGGFFVFERNAFSQLDLASNVALEDGLLEKLAAQERLAVYKHDGFWQCMDTYREMQLLDELWRNGRAPWKTWS